MRAHRVETAVLAKLAEGSDNPEMAIAAAFLERPKDLERIQRYVTAAERAYYKALNELVKLQKARAAAEHEAAMMEALISAERPIGSVSQNETKPALKAPAQPAALYAMTARRHDESSAPLS
jgi:hypothetical protein